MRQNLIIVLLSVIATLLLVLVGQNFARYPIALGQLGGGGSSSVGTIGVATGSVKGEGEASAFWIYEPAEKKVLVYMLGLQNRMEVRAVRDISWDIQAPDFAMPVGRGPSVQEMEKVVTDYLKKKKK